MYVTLPVKNKRATIKFKSDHIITTATKQLQNSDHMLTKSRLTE